MTTVVVGVDGSDGSVRALRFALEEARARGANVKAVGAWDVPLAAYESGWVTAPIDFGEFATFTQSALDKALEDAGAAGSEVDVMSVVRQGQPADVLCAEAQGADLLVVGSRGLGGFRGLMLGSVSQQCSHHTPCPLVIVPNSAPEKASR
jgi:nucleotide-binding universal stress UspA family protein